MIAETAQQKTPVVKTAGAFILFHFIYELLCRK